MRATLVARALCGFLTIAGLFGADAGQRIARWQPHDFTFSAQLPSNENPFFVKFAATVTAPDGANFTVPGFYDGDGVWKVRVSANAVGRWSLTTTSEHPALSGQQAHFTCVENANPRVHGALRVDREHPRHFKFEDGTRFFLQGYECDWLWALDLGKPGIATTGRFLDKIASHGFNYVILNAYAHDTNWRRGATGPDDYGPPPLYAWEGTNEKPDHQRLNLAYWGHYDRVIAALHERGMQAHILMKVYNKRVTWPERGSREDDVYFRWLIARYAAYPNVIWDFAKEAHLEKDPAYKLGRIRLVRETDGYRRLLTTHDDDKINDSGAYDDLHDFRTDQQHPNYRAAVLRQHARRDWPVFNAESHYEWGPGGAEDKTWRNAQSPQECARIAWEIAMAGGYMAYYYTYTAWDVIRPDDTPTGYAYFQHFGRFFRNTQYWKLKSSDHLVNAGWCLADPGREYVVFLEKPQPFTLQLGDPAEDFSAYWFDPHTGKTTDAGRVAAGIALTPPRSGTAESPVVLHVRAIQRN